MIFSRTGFSRRLCLSVLLGLVAVCPVFGGGLKSLSGHVPTVARRAQWTGDLPATNELHLALGLPLRDEAGLSNFLAAVSDPASPDYRRFLTPEEFTARFGPTEQDYAAVREFARSNGFQIAGTHGNRLLLDVRGRAGDIQRAFHTRLKKFRHPTGDREFFAPDTEPVVDQALPLADVSGLSDYGRPRPKAKVKMAAAAAPKAGSAPGGYLLGDDFRSAYAPGVTLTGAGQQVGLVQFDNYYPSDVSDYARLAGGGRTNIPIQTVLVGGYGGTIGGNNIEVALDIQMAMAMAPGLDQIIIFTAGPYGLPNDVLNRMATSNSVKNLSCSWGWSGGPDNTTENIFKQMAAQGQSFFNASGDSEAFTPGVSSVNGVDNPSELNAPSSSPNITQVGGTALTTGSGGTRLSETVWSGVDGIGSSGGISSYYAIPAWQTSVSMAGNQGSTSKRNIPDVALTADDIYCIYNHGTKVAVVGTSAAAPLWAGFSALVNERAAQLGKPSVGFINPAIYALGTGGSFAQCFHDIITGNNSWSGSPSAFYAVTGYDLCTGWGTPAGPPLIEALAGTEDSLEIASDTGFAASGVVGGPVALPSPVITLSNSGNATLIWELLNTNPAAWLNLSPAGGELAALQSTQVVVQCTAAAAQLALGTYSASLKFTNLTAGALQTVAFRLQILPALSVSSAGGWVANGPVGGPFYPAAQTFTIANHGATSAVWSVKESASWLAVNAVTGAVAAGGTDTFTVSLTTNAGKLKAKTYKATVTVRDHKKKTLAKLPFFLRVGQNLVTNGGFEAGDFSGWTLAADSTRVTNNKSFLHAGRCGAQLGHADTLGSLSQTLPTAPGQSYLLSFWLANPPNSTGATPNEFAVQWEGAMIYSAVDVPFGGWTNRQFTVTATGTNALLQFAFRHDPYFLALDDVSLKPVTNAPVILAGIKSAVSLGRSFRFAWRVTPGQVYQVQYQTNLLSADWIDLGGPVAVPTDTLTVTDTNAFELSPQRFYRLRSLPPGAD